MTTLTQANHAPQRPTHTTPANPKPAQPLFSRREVRRLVAAMIG